LSEAERSGLDEAKAIQLMAAHPTLIKRPVLEFEDGRIEVGIEVGFTPERYAELFGR